MKPLIFILALALSGCAIERTNWHPIAIKNDRVELNPRAESWNLFDGGPPQTAR